MAATAKQNVRILGPSAPRIRRYTIAATQGVYIANSPCYLCQAGTIKRAATAASSDAWSGLLPEGVAAQLDSGTSVKVAMLTSETLLAGYIEDNGSDQTAANVDVAQCGHTVSATATEVGYTTIDINNSNATVQIVGTADDYCEDFTSAQSPGVVLFNVLNTVIQASKS